MTIRSRDSACVSSAATEPSLDIVGEFVDGREAIETLTDGDVELVFLDVEMPRLDGFGVVAEVGVDRMPPVIFTSAYSEFAVRAFEAYALDYLLKPFDDARFATAVARARERVDSRRAAMTTPRDVRICRSIHVSWDCSSISVARWDELSRCDRDSNGRAVCRRASRRHRLDRSGRQLRESLCATTVASADQDIGHAGTGSARSEPFRACTSFGDRESDEDCRPSNRTCMVR